MNPDSATVFIGMPVFNGESTVKKAIESLLSQTYKDFILFISDNASTDQTADICKSLQKKDARILYFRQEQTTSPLQNFQFVLKNAVSRYFMWAACDDFWEPFFIEKNFKWLEENSDFCGSITTCIYKNSKNPEITGALTIDHDNSIERMRSFNLNPAANCLFHSLWRTAALKEINLLDFEYLAGDWAIVTELLRKGKVKCLEGKPGFIKSDSGMSSDVCKYLDSNHKKHLEIFFPLYNYYKFLKKILPPQKFPKTELKKQNLKIVKFYFRKKVRKLLSFFCNHSAHAHPCK